MKDDNTLAGGIIIIVVLAVMFFGTFQFNMMDRDYGMMGAYWTGGYGFMWIFMMIIWILIVIILVLGIIWLMRQLQNDNRRKK